MIARCNGLVLVLTLLSTGCMPLAPLHVQGVMRMHSTEREATGPLRIQRASLETAGHLDRAPARQSALAAQLAFRGALLDVTGSARQISGALSRLKRSHLGIAGRADGLFLPYLEYGEQQLRWIDDELAASTRLLSTASEVMDADMQMALLRLAGPRLEAAMLGSFLLAAWLDCLHLADGWLQQGFASVEVLFVNMDRWQEGIQPAMTALSSLEPGQVEAAAKDAPALMGHLAHEFTSLTESLRVATKRTEQIVRVAQLFELITQLSALKLSLPALPTSAPAVLGTGLVMGSNGVVMGTRLVVSAEWVEGMRQLIRAGVLSLPVVSAVVRIQAGQVLLAQAHDELPRAVRDALGDSPEVRSMRVTGRAGAGMNRPPRHHLLPKEFREWFEQRGFAGEMDIDQFCVEMQRSHHEAIHGGGDWKLGRLWPGEWNQMTMNALRGAEARTGRRLTPSEVLTLVAKNMRDYKIPMTFIRWRGG